MSGVRQQRQVEELCAATLRALTGDGELHFRGHLLHRGERPLRTWAPHLRIEVAAEAGAECFPALRAHADGMALRLLHSDSDLHRGHCPADPVERLIFELLEQLRVETLAPDSLPGLTANLQRRFAAWSRRFHESGNAETSLGILFHTVAQVAWSRLNALPVPEDSDDLIEATRAGIAPALGPAMAAMRGWRHDQARFAPHALEVAHLVGAMVRAEREDTADEDTTQQDPRAPELLPDFDREEADAPPLATGGEGRTPDASGPAYRAWNTRWDTELDAATLVRKALLRDYRERLDAFVARQGINVPRLARLFGALLARPQRDDWLFGEEDGRIDGRRLAQLVSSPAESRLFKRERTKAVADAALTLLVDCSGSMRGLIEPVAALADILARSLDMVGVDCEVLGFTTGAWNGGRPYRDWMARGRPPAPGRLNESCHLVFKEAARNWRRSRAGIAALLKADLFREGIDGEAVDWACERLLAQDAGRRILIVVSDGCPMDSATTLANDDRYLDRHLREVVARREREGAVEIIGLGVGLDLSPYYRRSVSADFAQGLDNTLFFELARLMRD
jgi:cobaltochelatase CobT